MPEIAGKPLPEKGDRIRVLSFHDDPDPIPVGTEGTVTRIVRFDGHPRSTVRGETWWQVSVDWDIPRSLMLVIPPDEVEIL